MNGIVSLDFKDLESKNHLCCLGLRYNQQLKDIANEVRKVLGLDDNVNFVIVNEFCEPIPLEYRIRCNVSLFLSFVP